MFWLRSLSLLPYTGGPRDVEDETGEDSSQEMYDKQLGITEEEIERAKLGKE